MVKWLVVSIAIMGALVLLGIDLRGLWSVLAATLSLVAIGFVAMWSILSHMLASVLLVTFRPFQIGDKIEIVGDDSVVGKVIDMSLVYTTLRTSDGSVLRIPNNLFFQKVLKRFPPGSLDASSAVALQEPNLTGANTQ
jgi:small-conductance mechanosensitive channel